MKNTVDVKTVQFINVNFPGLTPNSYDYLNNMKLNLNVFTRSVNFNVVQITRVLGFSLQIRQGDYKFLPGVWLCIF